MSFLRKLISITAICASYFSLSAVSIETRIETANAYIDSNPDSAVTVCDNTLQILSDNDFKNRGLILSVRGNALFAKGENALAIESMKQAVEAAKAAADSLTLANALSDMGVMYRVSQRPDTALILYNSALEIFNQLDTPAESAHLLTSIAILFTNQGRIEEAIPYARKAFDKAIESDDIDTEMYAGSTLGIILFHGGKTEEGLNIERRIVTIAETKGAPRYVLKAYASIIDMHHKEGNADSVSIYLNRGRQLLDKVPEGSVEALGFMEESYVVLTAMKRYRESLEIQYKLLSMDGAGTFSPLDKLWQRIGRNHQGLGNIQQMGEAYERAIAVADSLHGLEIDEQLSEFNVKYSTAEKELEIARLEAEKAQERQRSILWLAIAAVILATGFVLTISHLRIMRRKAELAQVKAELNGIEHERARLAQELHDGVCNDLVGVQLMLESSATERKEVVDLLNRVRSDVRSISHNLMPPSFSRTSLSQLLTDYALRSNGMIRFSIKLSDGMSSEMIPEQVSHEIYRIVQEWVGNIRQHSSASKIEIILSLCRANLQISIQDNGEPNQNISATTSGIGFETIARRVASINAFMEQTSCDGLNIMTISTKIA